jgi:hypothetical protein
MVVAIWRSVFTLLAAAVLTHLAVAVEAGVSSPSAMVPTPQSVPLLISMPAELSTKANAPATRPPLTWENTLLSALALSKSQNGGTAKVSMTCFPKQNLCSFAVLFKMQDGMDAMIRFTKDASGLLVQKGFCDFDRFGDTRTCIDWDTAETHREWKNPQGDWVKVGDR